MNRLLILTLVSALATSAIAQIDFKARDAAMVRGSITYHEMDGTVAQKDVTLSYTPDGYCEREEFTSAGPPKGTVITYARQSAWNFSETATGGSDLVVFNGPLPALSGPEAGIAPLPSITLVGGFSQLRGVTKTSSGPLVISGAMPDNLTVKITYGSQQSKGIPDRIERFNGRGTLVNAWVFIGSINAGDNLYIPRHVLYENGIRQPISSFDIKKADFSAKPTHAQLLPNWFHPGATFSLAHAVAPVDWSYKDLLAANGGNTNLDSDHFLRLSEEKFSRNPPAPVRSIIADQDPAALGLPLQLVKYEFGILVLAGMSVALVLVFRRKLAR